MAFPTTLDNPTNPVATDNTVTVPHATQHTDANNSIKAIEAKIGIDGSLVNTSIDYKLGEVTGADKAVGKSATQDLTNKTLGAGTKVTLGSDATGDIYYRHSDGTLKRLPIGTANYILNVNSGVPAWREETSVVDASTTAKGVVEEATLAEIDAGTGAGSTSARLFVNPSTLGKSTDGTMASNSDAKIPSEKAVKTYVDNGDFQEVTLTKGTSTWICPRGVTQIYFDAVAGGGAGSFAFGGNIPSGGGGGAGLKNQGVIVVPFTGYTIVVGAGGVSVGGNGSNTTLFGYTLVAGGGGSSLPGTAGDATAGAGGANVNHNGGVGTGGGSGGTGTAHGAGGGASGLGTNGGSGSAASNGSGVGGQYGAGGGGGGSAGGSAGGNGGDGLVVIKIPTRQIF
jgi:hypothetical protein